jgi:hypothetical protein
MDGAGAGNMSSAIWANHRRWGDNDRYFGPLTYARDRRGYRPLAIALASGCDEYPGASFRISGFGHTVILALPAWATRPYREKVFPKNWDEATVKRIGRDWYWDIDSREFSFSIVEGSLHIRYGRQANSSLDDKSLCYFLPWTQWRHIRRSFYDLRGEHFATLPKSTKGASDGLKKWEHDQEIQDSVPTASFEFDDFDGERITAKTKIDESEWRFGTGWCKWLSLFRRPKISRSLDLRFSAEVGKRKGSWKGGTIGHSIEMRTGELHEAAFKRYCKQEGLTFVGRSAAKAGPGPSA